MTGALRIFSRWAGYTTPLSRNSARVIQNRAIKIPPRERGEQEIGFPNARRCQRVDCRGNDGDLAGAHLIESGGGLGVFVALHERFMYLGFGGHNVAAQAGLLGLQKMHGLQTVTRFRLTAFVRGRQLSSFRCSSRVNEMFGGHCEQLFKLSPVVYDSGAGIKVGKAKAFTLSLQPREVHHQLR